MKKVKVQPNLSNNFVVSVKYYLQYKKSW